MIGANCSALLRVAGFVDTHRPASLYATGFAMAQAFVLRRCAGSAVLRRLYVTTLLNPNVVGLPPSATLAINELSNKLRAQGKTVFKLGLGQSPFPVPKCMVDELKKHAHEKDYLPVKGLPALREAIAANSRQKKHTAVTADDVIIGPGSKELLFLLQLCFPGTVMLPGPSWVSYDPQAHILGREVVWLPCSIDEAWKLSPDVLQHHCEKRQGKPCLLVLNYPSNPTGQSFTEEELIALANVARAHNLLVLSDEIYGDLTFVGKHTSIARHYPEGTIVLGGVSKWAGAGGWRMGAFTFPPELRWLLNAMASVASESYSCVSAPIQYGAIAAYTNTKEMHEYLENSRRVLNMVATFVVDRLRAGGAKVVPPEGGFYVLPDFSEVAKWASTGEEFCLKLLEEEGVAILPSHFFGRQKGEISARLAFVDFEGAGALTGVVGVARGQENNLKHATEFVTAYCPSIKLAMDKLVSFLHRRSHETR